MHSDGDPACGGSMPVVTMTKYAVRGHRGVLAADRAMNRPTDCGWMAERSCPEDVAGVPSGCRSACAEAGFEARLASATKIGESVQGNDFADSAATVPLPPIIGDSIAT